ncbi:hypothetical protein N1851_018398 [Merluccius polli]|uniref:Uncharacterized protein n=1 Tax=Merluccius polli TaxID=89951 RepID=A0AA47MNW0_MERPO|nr:hypothetical protein N1851_018398 [Merluccius polli]
MAPMSNAERQRLFRSRHNADPDKRQQYLEMERQRWSKDVKRGKKLLIKDLSERDQRQLRKKWKGQNERRKQAKARMKSIDTPPESPEIFQPGERQQAGPSRDDVSRITTGCKQTLTRCKVKKQKRFLMDTMKNIHRKFLSEQMHMISYSLFCRLRPFWVVFPSLSDRDTCLCKTHDNLEFVVMKMFHLKLINTTDLEMLTKMISCDTNNKICMYDECAECKKQLILLPAYDKTKMVSCDQWGIGLKEKKDAKDDTTTIVRYTLKKQVEDTQENLVDLFHALLHKFKRHTFNITKQFFYVRELKKTLSEEEAIIHIDFSENYTCKYSSEIQSVHFGSSHNQATLHTVSPSKHKSPPAIWEHMAPILDYLKHTYPQVSVLHFLSDGPATQYKQRGNLFLFSTELARRGLKGGTWNFFEASHGKGAPDGVGGALKRTADKLVTQGRDIPDANKLFQALSETDTRIKLFYISAEAVDQAVLKMPDQIPAVPAIMKCHQVVTISPGEVMYREVSCMCSTRKQLNCECFSTLHFNFSKPAQKAPNAQNVRQEAIDWEKENLFGKWCVIKYDNDLYPGIILDIDETHAKVKCMCKVKGGDNKCFWPITDDILWYLFDDVLEVIEPPQPVTSRHVGIQTDVWKRLTKI